MNIQEFEKRCLAFTKELRKKPFSAYFDKIKPEILESEEYKKLDTRPMDYSTVYNNLSAHRYHNYHEWAKDMYLIFY